MNHGYATKGLAGMMIAVALVVASTSRAWSASRQPARYDLIAGIKHYAHLHRLPPGLVAAVVDAESDANPCAVSRVGAAGLMQLTAPTARMVGVQDRFSPKQNLAGGTAYLAQAIKRAHGNVWRALGVYNWSGAALKTPPRHWPTQTLRYANAIHRYLVAANSRGWRSLLPAYVARTSRKRCRVEHTPRIEHSRSGSGSWLSLLAAAGSSPQGR